MHKFPNMEEAQRLLAQQKPAMMTKLFPQGEYMMNISSSSLGNVQGSTKDEPFPGRTQSFIHMVGSNIYVSNRARDYGKPKSM
jgi:hypothetical protein